MIVKLYFMASTKISTNIINLTVTLITTFPLFISILNSIIKIIRSNYHIQFLDSVISILDILEVEPDKQLDTLLFTNIIAAIQSIIFFINRYYFKDLFKTFIANNKIDFYYKIFLFVKNIIITIIILLLNPDLNIIIN